LAVYEVANAVWKHEHILKDLESGKPYLSIFFGLIEAGRIIILSPHEDLIQESYLMTAKHRITVYDAIYVSLAIKLGLTLKSYDKTQLRTLNSENTSKP